MKTVAVIGGGPAGMIAAAEAGKRGLSATLFERNEKLGKKLYITGKGRCNVTNAAPIDEYFLSIPRNPKFLYSALYGFTNADMTALLDSLGVSTKTERGSRVFPQSDKSSDVIRALVTGLKNAGVEVRLNSNIKGIIKNSGGGFTVETNGGAFCFDSVILASGGASYPATGSNGDGYALAKSLGHTVTDIRPSLIALETEEEWPGSLAGLALKNVRLRAENAKGKSCYDELGELMFTHHGVGGPLTLSLSSVIADAPAGVKLYIDMKPGLSPETLDARLLRDFEKNIRRRFINSLDELLPMRMIAVIIALSGIDPQTPVNSITREQRGRVLSLLKALPLTVRRAGPIAEAVITRGGVDVREINASTMESKLVPGLFFAGEVIDVDGFTGGFNLQIAWSTGALAGRSV